MADSSRVPLVPSVLCCKMEKIWPAQPILGSLCAWSHPEIPFSTSGLGRMHLVGARWVKAVRKNEAILCTTRGINCQDTLLME